VDPKSPSRYFSLVAPSGSPPAVSWPPSVGSLFRAAASALFIHARYTPRAMGSQPAGKEGERRRERERAGGCWWRRPVENLCRRLRQTSAMGDSSGSVSIDVERMFFGGKVRARVPASRFSFPHFGLGASKRRGFLRIGGRVSCCFPFSSSSCVWLYRCLLLKFLFLMFPYISRVLISINACKLRMLRR
jgi:hypothetical protein